MEKTINQIKAAVAAALGLPTGLWQREKVERIDGT